MLYYCILSSFNNNIFFTSHLFNNSPIELNWPWISLYYIQTNELSGLLCNERIMHFVGFWERNLHIYPLIGNWILLYWGKNNSFFLQGKCIESIKGIVDVLKIKIIRVKLRWGQRLTCPSCSFIGPGLDKLYMSPIAKCILVITFLLLAQFTILEYQWTMIERS